MVGLVGMVGWRVKGPRLLLWSFTADGFYFVAMLFVMHQRRGLDHSSTIIAINLCICWIGIRVQDSRDAQAIVWTTRTCLAFVTTRGPCHSGLHCLFPLSSKYYLLLLRIGVFSRTGSARNWARVRALEAVMLARKDWWD